MALVTPYCTLVEADSYLTGASWIAATDSEKNQALFWGRVYLDSKYSCVYFDVTDAPDEIKYANALLAEDHIEGNLIESSSVEGRLTRKRVKAGSVETEKEYMPGATAGSPQDDVTNLLSSYCTKNGASKMILRV